MHGSGPISRKPCLALLAAAQRRQTAGAPPQEPQHQPRRERDDPGVDPDAGRSEQTADGGGAHREWTKYGRARVCSRPGNRMQPGQAKTSPKTIAGRENSIGTKPVEKLGSKPNRITDGIVTLSALISIW